ncbi:nicotinate-nucleotide--dimethylbenzimidazole phosphoribosyltransferase [Paracoccus sp. 1_MG-2023]|uniref:nicotinate-nucleotide--dimethylbenzimidazole phosphoribosyltransferase n=1 Tax=unclassified Paracoccus (in: a-proteobacteria) TaxID=2688777 RepID=UPI001C093577|nr:MULTISPECIES: nicotinate-nucleotide--dimethylbenzimidazole phosphoribosyltransferase [unclassified Paracoccus (in: a-proteobacteria)]MBU2958819.1 nicotinate-nucleotide--dimethylbenzimidazole phosphoribosyltransferase [Paracoccus sp. C2R09]MDO6670050.1 nicotinate-nucleotide--dimethylbenzimidazole phosphoribosyltransferase [Paracoccus sp. 1_MG-2023]
MSRFDQSAAEAARVRQDQLTKPQGALGRLEDLAVFMAGWQGRERPRIDRAQALVFAGNHGVVAQGITPFPPEVTAAMVANFDAGGAAINQLCRVAGADLSVVALDLDRPTADFTTGPAMTAAEVTQAMAHGADAVDADADILILGEMGIGNSTIAAALAASVLGGRAEDWVGPGTGSVGEQLAAKMRVVTEGLALHAPDSAETTLAAFGGREQAAICGAIRRARDLGIPVILDGFICCAAAIVLTRDDPDALSHCLVGHESAEPGHRQLIAAIGSRPILSLDMRLGEGSGAAVALMVLRAALECHDGMATFAEAGIG